MSENDGAGLLLSHRFLSATLMGRWAPTSLVAKKKLVGTQKLLPFHVGCLHFTSFYRSQNSQPSCRRTSAFGYWCYWWAPRVHRLACTPMTASLEPNVGWTKCWHRSVFVGAMGRKWSKYLFAEALFRHGRKMERPEAGAARKQSKQKDVLAFS